MDINPFNFETYRWRNIIDEAKLRAGIQSQLLPTAEEHRTHVQFHSLPIRWNELRILLHSMLDATQKQFSRRLGQAHLLGTSNKAMEILIRSKDDRSSVLFAKALQALPNGGTIVQRGSGRRKRESGIGIFVNRLKQRPRIRRGIIVFLAPFTGGRQMNIR